MSYSSLDTKSLQDSYNSIADHFSHTRKKPWLEFEYVVNLLHDSARVLELGCGNGRLYGYLKEKFPHIQYTGIDISSAFIDMAQKQYGKEFFEIGDMSVYQGKKNSLDAVVSIAGFHHLQNKKKREETLLEIQQMLQPDGFVFFTVWNLFQKRYILLVIKSFFASLFSHTRKFRDCLVPYTAQNIKKQRYYYAFYPQEFKKLLETAGFVDIHLFYTNKKGLVDSWKEAMNICILARKQKRNI